MSLQCPSVGELMGSIETPSLSRPVLCFWSLHTVSQLATTLALSWNLCVHRLFCELLGFTCLALTNGQVQITDLCLASESAFARYEVNEEAPVCWACRPPLVECHKLRLAAPLATHRWVTLKCHKLELHWRPGLWLPAPQIPVFDIPCADSFSSADIKGSEGLGLVANFTINDLVTLDIW